MCFWIFVGVLMAWADTVYSQSQSTETDAPLPGPPPMFRAEPAVLEAVLIIQGKSIAHFIPDGRVVR